MQPLFPIHDYMEKQTHLTKWMRSLLVDWIVEVQETFELNHETVYLAVKLVDLYLCKVLIHKDKLQLLGAAALFIACKYDVSFVHSEQMIGCKLSIEFSFSRNEPHRLSMTFYIFVMELMFTMN